MAGFGLEVHLCILRFYLRTGQLRGGYVPKLGCLLVICFLFFFLNTAGLFAVNKLRVSN